MKKKLCADLLKEFKEKNSEKVFKTDKIRFENVDGRDVYNITAPFKSAGKIVIAGRVEGRKTEYADVVFFEEKDEKWYPIEGACTFKLQDPFFTKIGGELILGGVEIYPDPDNTKALAWRTIYYRGADIFSLEKFAKGPNRMKDLRLVELANGKIGIFTRPQGKKGGRGSIGYIEMEKLDDLTDRLVNSAPLFDHFYTEEWGGGNEVHLLKNGKLGVLSHVAYFDADEIVRHYYPTVFCFDPKTKEYTEMELIGYRDLFKPGVAKRYDLEDVVFSGGLVRKPNGKAVLYAGIGDAEAHWIEIDDPFIKWEK
ncbi:MAG: DUF1861 family protein [Psychrilyobacter sp.]|uniref:DUF1861 family protein n=1 Tax=Psychrilyobacter sp. TaxID=2586924 RepID=UPI003C75832A